MQLRLQQEQQHEQESESSKKILLTEIVKPTTVEI